MSGSIHDRVASLRNVSCVSGAGVQPYLSISRLSNESAAATNFAIHAAAALSSCANTSVAWNVRFNRMMLSSRSNANGACSAESRNRNSSPIRCLPGCASGDEKHRCSEQQHQILIGALPL